MSGTATIQTNNLAAQPVANSTIPPEGPKAIPFSVNFSTNPSYSLNILNIIRSGAISRAQTIFVDNSANSAAVTITSAITSSAIIAPPYSQGYYPVLVPNPPNLTFVSSGSATVNFQLINVPMPSSVWLVSGTQGTYVAGALLVKESALDGTIANNKVATSATPAATAAVGGNAFSVATGGTAVTAILAGAITQGAIITNPFNATESLFIDLVNTAQASQSGGTNGTSFELKAGQSFNVPPVTGAVSAIAATSGHAFSVTVF